jgi:hypothetical protein
MKKRLEPDRIIQGIKSIISENRYSLSKEDLSLLEECINELKNYPDSDDSKLKLTELITLCELLLRFFIDQDVF